jgi:hypothetical protein
MPAPKRPPKAQPTPPTDEEIREVAEAFDVSLDVARTLLGSALISGTELPDGTIIDA